MVCQNCLSHIKDGLDKCPVCDNDPTKKADDRKACRNFEESMDSDLICCNCGKPKYEHSGGADMKVSRERDGRLGATCHALPPLDNKGVFVLAVMAGACCAKGTAAEAAEIVVRATTISRKCFQSVNKGNLEVRAIGFLSWFYSASVNAVLPSWIEFETEEGE